MARRKNRPGYLPEVRDFNFIANRRLDFGPRARIALAQLEALRREALSEIEDRRRFHPDRQFAPARDRNTRRARIVAASLLGSALSFQDPTIRSGSIPGTRSAPAAGYSGKVAICVRRKTRREVLFARGKGGGGAKRSRRRNYYSEVKC